MTKLSPNFITGIASISRGEILIAPLRAYLQDPEFESFTITVGGIGMRPWDGRFHPSEHPSFNERSLYLYLTDHEVLIPELRDPTAVMSMTAGSIWHAIVNKHILHEALGILSKVEIPVSDPETLTTGHMDGQISHLITPTGEIENYELKTMKEALLNKIGSVEDYLRMFPDYHLQANEYMRMTGIHRMRVLLMSLTFPYPMKEFVIPYDERLALRTERKYRTVIQAVADQRVPMCEGCFNGNTCPSRGYCKKEFGLR